MASSSSSKTLLRTSLSLLNRLTITTPKLLSPPPPPPLFPFLNTLQITPNEEASVTKLCSEGFLYPTGLPSIPFLLPEGEDSSSSEPILFHPKRTYQPSIIRRKRNHGFFARKATVGGRRVIKRRVAKGRYRITA